MGLHILNGWKEISSYIERAARTAQRWELQFGMPVHRPASKRRNVVVALADELDVRLIRNADALNGESHRASDETDRARLQETLFRLQFETKELTAKLLHLEHLHDTSNSNDKGSP